MGTTAKPTRENRTITVDFRSEATYFQLLGDGKAFLECVLAFVYVPWLSAHTQGDLPRRRMPHPSLPLWGSRRYRRKIFGKLQLICNQYVAR